MVGAVDDFETAIKAYFDRRENLQAFILVLFAGINMFRIFAYVPQIVKAANDTNGASAISFTTWGLFTISNLTTSLYAIVCLADLVMAMIFLGNAFACIAIVVVAFRNRWKIQLHNLPDT